MNSVDYNFYDFNFFENLHFNFNLATSKTPEVSIIIPVYNQIDYTLNCLYSLKEELFQTSCEIIVINDCSTDNTLAVLNKIESITIINNEKNLGFLRNINLGIKQAKGEKILLLNNDVVVLPNFLKELLVPFKTYDNVGAVGAKAIHPTQIILEAGSAILNNGTSINLGREHVPHHPADQGIKVVDYCSGYCLLLNRHFPDGNLVQLDEHFIPAYYEETDLCMTLKHKYHLDIFYTGFAELIHFESISYNDNKSAKKQQLLDTNKQKFLDKWKRELKTYSSKNVNPYLSVNKYYTGKAKVYLDDKISSGFEQNLINNHSIKDAYIILVYKKMPNKKTLELLRRKGIDVRYPYVNRKNKTVSYFKITKRLKQLGYAIETNSLYYKLLLSTIKS